MNLVFIHGAPGAGKLTTARALLWRVNGRLFENHAAIDVARTVFDFGAPGFWELVQRVRMSVIDAAAERRVPLLVMTFVYVEPTGLPIFEQFEATVLRHGAQLLPVFLQCSTAEIVRRIGNADSALDRRLAALAREAEEADERLRRLYKLIEDGRNEADDILSARIAELRLVREKAHAALERARSAARGVEQVSPLVIERFTRTMREKLTSGEIPFRKAYLGSLDSIEVDDAEVRIVGRKDALEKARPGEQSGPGRCFIVLYRIGEPSGMKQ